MEELNKKQTALAEYGEKVTSYGGILLGLAFISFMLSLNSFSLSSFAQFAMPAYFLYVASKIKQEKPSEITGEISAVWLISIVAIIVMTLSMFDTLSILRESISQISTNGYGDEYASDLNTLFYVYSTMFIANCLLFAILIFAHNKMTKIVNNK